jgi:hypothetical protein
MDFPNRSTQPQTVAPASHVGSTPQSSGKKSRLDQGKWGKVGIMTMLCVVAVLLLALVVFVAYGNNGVKDENSYVDTNKLQAVFLNTGQVYFGNVKALNSKYFVLTNIYYLQTSSGSSSSSTSSANTSVSLVKLGCELHAPYDQMVINADQVTFWENLQSDGQVAQAVQKFEAANPNGQKCSDQSSSSSSTTNSVQSAGSNNTPATTTKP